MVGCKMISPYHFYPANGEPRILMEGPTHHFALGVGHHAAEIKKLGKALGIETVVVTEEK